MPIAQDLHWHVHITWRPPGQVATGQVVGCVSDIAAGGEYAADIAAASDILAYVDGITLQRQPGCRRPHLFRLVAPMIRRPYRPTPLQAYALAIAASARAQEVAARRLATAKDRACAEAAIAAARAADRAARMAAGLPCFGLEYGNRNICGRPRQTRVCGHMAEPVIGAPSAAVARPLFGDGYHNRERWGAEIAANLRGATATTWMRRMGDRMARCRSWVVESQGAVELTEACRSSLCPQGRRARGQMWAARLTPWLERNEEEGLSLDGSGRIWRDMDSEWRAALGYAAAARDTAFTKLQRLDRQDQRGPTLRYWPLFLTLTLRNVPRLQERDGDGNVTWNVLVDHFGASWRTMRETARRHPDSGAGRLWGHIVGGVKALEITWNERAQTWHPHAHVLVLADVSYISGRELAELWEHYADAYIVDVRAVDGHREGGTDLRQRA